MATSFHKRTRRLTLSAMLTALGVVFLGLGSLFEVLDISAAALASLLCVYAVIELGGLFPVGIWLATSILSLILLPVKTPALFYAVLLGFYPIIKEKAEKRRKLLAWVIKLLAFHLSILLLFLAFRLFLPEQMTQETPLYLAALYLLGVVTFVIYDIALTRLITFYLLRWRQRFRLK